MWRKRKKFPYFCAKFSEKKSNFCSKPSKAAWEYRRDHTEHHSSDENTQIKNEFFSCSPVNILKSVNPGTFRIHLSQFAGKRNGLRGTLWLSQKFSEVLSALGGYISMFLFPAPHYLMIYDTLFDNLLYILNFTGSAYLSVPG